MYESPISIYETAMNTIIEQRENAIFAKVQDAFDVQVDKDELIRALQYDRDQYKKGYKDGKRAAMAELVRCKDCQMLCRICANIAQHCSLSGIPVDDDDFCSFGERKDNG